MQDCDTRADIDSLMDWWKLAGVDVAIAETPTQWLTSKSDTPKPIEARARIDETPPPPVAVAPADLPATLESFLEWLATDKGALASYPVSRRIGPSYLPGADMMVVADVPEAGDVEAGRLLSGDVGLLIDRMLGAMGRDRASVHLATIAPARPANGRLDDAEQELLAPILRHHVALVAPKKLWLLGRAASRALLGMDETEAAGRLHSVNQNGVMIDAIATVHPRILLREPKLKARVWEDMKRLIEEPTA
ncbi:MAG: uracil-DNA glycosylase [Sphingomonadales bacterium]